METIEQLESYCRQNTLDLVIKLLKKPDIFQSLLSLDPEFHIIVLKYIFLEYLGDNKNFYETPEMKIISKSYIQRLKNSDEFNDLLSIIPYRAVQYFEKLAPLIILNAAFANLLRNPKLDNEIAILNANPMFFKNKIVSSIQMIHPNAPKVFNAIYNLEIFKLLAKELECKQFINYMERFDPIQQDAQLKYGSSEISTSLTKERIYSAVVPYMLLNRTSDVQYILRNAPNYVLNIIPSAIIKLLPLNNFPQKLIPLTATIFCYCNMHFLSMTKDLDSSMIMSCFILQYYPFEALTLIQELIKSKLFTKFLIMYGNIFSDCSYVVSQAILDYVIQTNDIEEVWIDHLNLDDRISADIASYLIQKNPETTNSLIKLSSKGLMAFHVVGNSMFTNEEYWTRFCKYYQNKPEYISNMVQLVSNILVSNCTNYKFTATKICYDLVLSRYDTYNTDAMFHNINNAAPSTEASTEVRIQFIDVLISAHPLKKYLIPLRDLIHDICHVNWSQVYYLIYYEQNDPKILCMKLKLFKYRANQNPIMQILHKY
ncbi:hypothetical protein TVAG_020260 [Trichomonas vaginalis G3]|uniref:Uncharacterized protein n=1 Tax=Trichomonas vaginalis (strain ATCC PRA-98 / G3) TaxID=412133 RepID=A2EQ15_TRIV3|nr:hypothetical protein TVAGG3_0338890 [Trichomonas vaginalis G3]EAY05280.1 hypothetical protein TVAG_020260 [Trichomonas vaginalis G3]KAI5530487.1 hypothetical protein TVAGG3_0338890 [Trichomonas vaginalis G3]|eukprot:XP_001317503.1 hypothetical protein [Trichomonas vaginalis G3]